MASMSVVVSMAVEPIEPVSELLRLGVVHAGFGVAKID
jgi:hypothetical protein